MYTSRNKFIISIVALILVAGSIFVFIKYRQQSKQTSVPQQVTEKNIEEIAVSLAAVPEKNDPAYDIDTDGDGLPDWEESLWNLNPQDPDTNGDGILDDEEVRNRKQEAIDNIKNNVTPVSTLTEGEKLGRSLYTALMAIQVAGGEFDEATQAEIEQNVVDYIAEIDITGGGLYTLGDLTVVQDTQSNSYNYRDELIRISDTYNPEGDVYVLLARGIQDQEGYLREILDTRAKYKLFLQELLVLPVPQVVSNRHLNFLNNILFIHDALDTMAQSEVDEIKALAAVAQLPEVIENSNLALEYIGIYFEVIEDDTIFNDITIPKLEGELTQDDSATPTNSTAQ